MFGAGFFDEDFALVFEDFCVQCFEAFGADASGCFDGLHVDHLVSVIVCELADVLNNKVSKRLLR